MTLLKRRVVCDVRPFREIDIDVSKGDGALILGSRSHRKAWTAWK